MGLAYGCAPAARPTSIRPGRDQYAVPHSTSQSRSSAATRSVTPSTMNGAAAPAAGQFAASKPRAFAAPVPTSIACFSDAFLRSLAEDSSTASRRSRAPIAEVSSCWTSHPSRIHRARRPTVIATASSVPGTRTAWVTVPGWAANPAEVAGRRKGSTQCPGCEGSGSAQSDRRTHHRQHEECPAGLAERTIEPHGQHGNGYDIEGLGERDPTGAEGDPSAEEVQCDDGGDDGRHRADGPRPRGRSADRRVAEHHEARHGTQHDPHGPQCGFVSPATSLDGMRSGRCRRGRLHGRSFVDPCGPGQVRACNRGPQR